MSRVNGPGRIGGAGPVFTNWRFDEPLIGSRQRPISEAPAPPGPSGYTPQVMMVM